MDIGWLNNKLPNTDETIQKCMKSMMSLADSALHTVRKIAADLRPGILDDGGLAAAIEWLGKDFGERTRINFSFHLDEELQIDEKRSTAFFRIFQETLTNVIHHANAKKVTVTLRKEGNNAVLLIEDNGRGITHHEIVNPRSVGLLGMKERAASFAGEIQILGQPGVGTTVRVSIPLSEFST